MSLSFSVSSRFKELLIRRSFLFIGLPHRNDAGGTPARCMHYHNDAPPQRAQGDITGFTIVAAGICDCQDLAGEDLFRGFKIDAVLAEVGGVLGLVPFESHPL